MDGKTILICLADWLYLAMRVPTIARQVSFPKYGPRDHGPDDLDTILLNKRRTVVSSLAVRSRYLRSSRRTNFQPHSHPVAAKTS